MFSIAVKIISFWFIMSFVSVALCIVFVRIQKRQEKKLILRVIEKKPMCSFDDIVQDTGLVDETVENLLEELRGDGIISDEVGDENVYQ